MRPRVPRQPGGVWTQARSLLLLGLLLSLGLAADSRAEEEKPADPDLSTKGMHKVGPFYLRPSVLLKNFGYDDNIPFDAAERVGDTTATVAPGLSALVLAGNRGGIFLSQEFDYVTFANHSDENHWNSASRARGIFLAKHVALSLEGRYRSVRDRPNLEIDQRLRENRNAVTAAFRTRGLGRLGVEAFLWRERIDFASDDVESLTIRERLNRDQQVLSLLGAIRLLPKTTFILERVLKRADFDEQREGRDTSSGSILAGLRFDPAAALQGELKAGVVSLRARERPEDDYRGFIGEGRLSTRFGRSGRLEGAFQRNLAFSSLAENLYFVATSWSVAYEQFFSRKLSGKLQFGRGLNHYPREEFLSEPTPRTAIRDDRFITYETQVRYGFNKDFILTARLSHLERDSTDDSRDRSRNLFAIGTSYYF